MPITDGTAEAIDYNKLAGATAGAVTEALRASGVIGQPAAAPAARESEYQKALAQIAAAPDSDRESLAALNSLMGGLASDVLARSQEEQQKLIINERVNNGRKMLSAEIDRLIDGDAKLAPLKKAITLLSERDFDESDEYAALRHKLASGLLEPSDVAKVAKKHFDDLTSERTQKKGLSGMETSVSPGAAVAQTTTPGDNSKKGLNEAQREVYDAILNEETKVAHLTGRKPDEIKAQARSRAEKKFQNGVIGRE